ncbi:hypothetical protein LCGC14_2750770 [marine sediment metagenome]|uniref:Uncharacterized protein n=1 Tax=marine sediment metagenome TaxID=412755 RepID=A0A0F9BAF6_9ZZZZ
MRSDKEIIKGMQQEHDRLIEIGREVERQLAEAQGKLEAMSEGLVRTGKWTPLPQPPGYLMCTVCCTGLRCECLPREHVSREGCPNCLGKSGSVFIDAILGESK